MRESGTAVRLSKEERMLKGSIFSGLFFYAFPLILSGILQLLYNAADLVVVGRYAADKELAIGAVSATGSIINLTVNLFMGLSAGASVSIALALGARNKEDASRLTHTAIATALLCGIGVGIFGFLMSPVFLKMTGIPSEIAHLSALYLRIYFCGTPALMVYNFGAAIMRTTGDTKRPFLILALSGLVNVVLNLLFVVGLHMSVDGVAYATIISQYLSAIAVTACLMRYRNSCRLELRRLRIHGSQFARILVRGIPAGVQSSLFSISNVMIQSGINSFGKTAVAGCGAGASIEGFVYTSINAYYHACLTFTGQNVGAGQHNRARRVFRLSLLQVALVGILVGGVAVLFAEPLVGIYIPDNPEAIPYGVERIRIVCLLYFLCGLMEVSTGASRGMGASLTPMIMSVVGIVGIRIMWLQTVFRFFPSLLCLFISYPISWFATAVAQYVGYRITRGRILRGARVQ